MSFLLDVGLPAPGWQGRVKNGAYVDPDGVRIEFLYDNVARNTTKRTSIFQFNRLDGAYVQDNGISQRDYPITCIFSGTNHDLEATAFENSLFKVGVGSLEHPLYGTFKVVPTGRIARSNNLVDEANVSTVQVTFSTTLIDVYPTDGFAPASELQQQLEGFDVVASQEFKNRAGLDSAINQAKAKAGVGTFLDTISATLESVSATTAAGRAEYDAAFRALNEGIDVLVGQPLNLAQQMLNLALAPARAVAGLQSKFDGYLAFIDAMLRTFENNKADSTYYAVNDLAVLSGVVGTIIASQEGEYQSRQQSIESASYTKTTSDDAIAAREELFKSTNETDEGGAYQSTQSSTTLGVEQLISSASGLPNEKLIILDHDASPVELCSEYYGSVSDSSLQFFLDTNDTGGDAFFLFERGREVKVFVDG